MASLDLARQKLIRAAEHLKCLEAEVLPSFSGHPAGLGHEIELERQRPILEFEVQPPIPERIPLIIADVLQNLRSSLDYLVWELVLANGYEPNEKNKFPICNAQGAFKLELRRHRLDGIPTPALAQIDYLQPYYGDEQRESQALPVLDALCNISQHRSVLLAARTVPRCESEIVSKAGLTTLAEVHRDGSALAVRPTPPQRAETLEADAEVLTLIVFDENVARDLEVCVCLDELWHHVNDVVFPEFESYFT